MNALADIIFNDFICQMNLDDYLSWRKSDIWEICQECIPSRLKQFEWRDGGLHVIVSR